MPYTPNADEIQATKYARELDAIIDSLLEKKEDAQRIIKLSGEISTFLNTTFTNEMLRSPYYQFLLQQCSRYNAFGQIYHIQEGDQRRTVQIYKNFAPIICNAAKLLPQEFNVSVPNMPQRFRPAYEDESAGKKRYYYSEDDVENFIKHYHKANTTIGGETQKTNARGAIKDVGKKIHGLFSNNVVGQDEDKYFKRDLHQAHEASRKKYAELIKCIEQGKPLSDEQVAMLEGQDDFYQYPTRILQSDAAPRVTHIGHATSLYQAGAFTAVMDPVHYQSGTGGIVGAAASVLYDRNTDPAISTIRYPGVNLVWISHNHYDHLCQKSVREAFPPNTIFVVPAGDAKFLKSWGYHNVIEMDWNTTVKLEIPGTEECLYIHAIPAKHASNRSINDYMESLYQGAIFEHHDRQGNKTLTLATGDTAVLADEHYEQLEAFIRSRRARVSLANIAAGPDRPRRWMECTHESSVDAMVVHAKLTVANLPNQPTTFAEVLNSCCHAVAYHQGCFRLGLVTYTEVLSTSMLLCAVIESAQQSADHVLRVDEMILDDKKNIYFAMMDNFERKGIKDLLQEYTRIKIMENGKPVSLSADQLLQLLSTSYHLPKIGSAIAADIKPIPVANNVDTAGLMVNKTSLAKLQSGISATNTITDLFTQACAQFAKVSSSKEKIKIFSEWLKDPRIIQKCKDLDATSEPHLKAKLLNELLCDLYPKVQGPDRHDEEVREEGNFETLIRLLAHTELKRYQSLSPMRACSSTGLR